MKVRPSVPSGRPAGGPEPVPVSPAASHVASTTAVADVRPVSPADKVASRVPHDVSRAGIDLQALAQRGTDELVVRSATGTVALADVLERARAAVVRGDGAEALAALDDAWEGAARTEGGWYYRGGALTVLGLPGEAERVLQQALVRRGGSVALHFLQSVVRSALGDAPAARESLAGALARRPADTVLQAWHAVLTARAGDRHGALQQLATLPSSETVLPVLTWARQAISAASVDVARSSAMAQWDDQPTADSARAPVAPTEAARPHATPADSARPLSTPSPLETAIRTVGAHLVHGERDAVRREVRALLQALSAGGTLDQTMRPDQVAATRSVLASVLGVLATGLGPQRGRGLEATADASGQWRATPQFVPVDHAPSGLAQTPRTAVLHALFAGDLSTASTTLQKVAATDGDAVAAALRLVVDGATDARRPAETGSHRAAPSHPMPPADTGTLRGADARSYDATLTPIRIGLSLLQESSANAEARAAVGSDVRTGASGVSFVAGAAPGVVSDAAVTAGAANARLSHTLDANSPAAHTAAALGAALTVPVAGEKTVPLHASDPRMATALSDSFRGGQRLRALALACMALAFTAMVYGHSVVAIALAGGASWLALRSSTVADAARRATQEDAGR